MDGTSVKRVLDAGAFIEGRNLDDGITTPAVEKETKVPEVVEIFSPRPEFVEKIREIALKTGDLDVLSRADLEVLALALQKNGIVVSNDFAVQNVASAAGLEIEDSGKQISRRIQWMWYCPACGLTGRQKGICDRCGTELKRKPRQISENL